jgi:L-ascorbate metabolism protein UlaG (beta-lactamase superfamily)
LDVAIVTDPSSEKAGKLPRNLSADIVTVSRNGHPDLDAAAVKGEPFLLEHPGEYEVKGVPVYGIPTKGNTVFVFTIEDLQVAHLGGLNETLTDEQLSQIGDVDILLLPIGGDGVLDAKKAADLVSRIEPRAVVPMLYKKPDAFAKEAGLKTEATDKWKVQKKDLSQEETRLMILAPS